MPKAFVALLAFTVALLTLVPATAGAQGYLRISGTASSSDLQTKIFQDTEGNVHVFWIVPALNNSLTGPGIWYSKYSPNGTDAIPPTRITNSTTIQSADLAVDKHDNAIIVWADEIASTANSIFGHVHSSFQLNSSRSIQVLVTHGSLLMWPSLAPDDNGTIYMTWTKYDPSTAHALVEYGWIVSSTFAELKPIASSTAK